MSIRDRLAWLKRKVIRKFKGEEFHQKTIQELKSEFLKVPEDTFIFLGDEAELHDRVYGAQGHFASTYNRIRSVIDNNESFQIVIGVSRYNFFKLDRIINFCFSLYGEEKRLNSSFDVFPVQYITRNFNRYIKELNNEINFQSKVKLKFIDIELKDILMDLQEQVRTNPLKERDFIRLFSVLCEKTFIGPATIVMDPFHRCNTNCRHCWVHTPKVKQSDEFLNREIDDDTFKAIVDDAAQMQTDLIIFQGDGEPLMYSKTIERLRYIRNKEINAMFFTNGYLLTKERAEEIIDMGVKEIYCSLPAGSSETYARVCPLHDGDGFFERIVENMKTLIKLRKKRGKEYPRLVMTHVMHNQNYQDLIKMAEVDAEINADAARFYLIRLDDMNMDLKLEEKHIKVMSDDLPMAEKILRKKGIHFIDNIRFQVENYDNDDGSWCKDTFLNQGCTIGWFFCLIPALTDLSLCCHLRTVGWLNKIRFKDLWFSDEYERYRRQAKNIIHNKDVTFMNGVKLWDEHCTHCDNHQTLIENMNELVSLKWDRYLDV